MGLANIVTYPQSKQPVAFPSTVSNKDMGMQRLVQPIQ